MVKEFAKRGETLKLFTLVASFVSVFLMIYLAFFFPGFVLNHFLTGFRLKSPMHFLIVGHDRNIEGTSRADVILVVGLDLEKKKMLLLSVPRDLEWNGKRVNSYFNFGVNKLKGIVEDILGIKMDGYAVFDYNSFKILGDELGPVEVVVKEPMNYVDEVQNLRINFLPGVHKLNGEQLLAYIRYRKGGMGDLDRIKRQREVFSELFSKALNMSVERAADLYSKLMNSVSTDISESEIMAILLRLKRGVSMNFMQLPVKPLDNGRVVLDEKKFKDVKERFLTFATESSGRAYHIVLMNAKRNKSKYFRPIEEKRWILMVGFKPDEILWEDTGIILKGSILLICTKDHKAREDLYRIVEKVYPHRSFKVRWAAYLDGADLYYRIMERALKIRRYLERPIDAVVILGEVGG